MWTRLGVAAAMILVTTGLGAAGCSLTSGNSDGSASAIAGRKFDKNHLLDDDVLMDDRAVTAEQIQAFLDRTPYGRPSPLAGYRDENGAPAAVLLHDAAVSYGVNPITLLVRIEMENGLISAGALTDAGASDDASLATPVPSDVQAKIESAFHCGRVLGLEGQAGCATRAVARAMMLLEDGQEANGGWKRGAPLKTKDNVTVTPSNAATAAIYVYTPYVGESGGGAKGTAGAAGHMGIWDLFAKALKYKGATCPADAGGCAADDAGTVDDDGGSTDTDAGADDTDGGGDVDSGDLDAGDLDADPGADAADLDASTAPSDSGHADAGKGGGKKDAAATVPGDDNPDDGSGHQTGTSGSSGGSYGSFPADPANADGDDAGAGAAGPTEGGCSTTGGATGDASSVALLLGLASIAARRRRTRAAGTR
jgi:MYXO-CTERM domain-containing protein